MKDHTRDDMKHNPTAPLNIGNGESGLSLLNRSHPQGPNVSKAGSREDLKGQLKKQQALEEHHSKLKGGLAKRSMVMPNGDLRNQSISSQGEGDDPFGGSGDSLTKPLQPEPRYTPAAVASTSQHNINGFNNNGLSGSIGIMGNGRGPYPPKSSQDKNKHSSKGRPTEASDEGLLERPRTRPGSQSHQNISRERISDDDF